MTAVLVVDDEFLIAEVVAVALEDMGFTVIKASNGRQAIEVLKREAPAIVISDFMMPVMNGLELATVLRQYPPWAKLPIILMTGGHVDHAQKHAHLFDCILQKPFNITTLINVVSQFTVPA